MWVVLHPRRTGKVKATRYLICATEEHAQAKTCNARARPVQHSLTYLIVSCTNRFMFLFQCCICGQSQNYDARLVDLRNRAQDTLKTVTESSDASACKGVDVTPMHTEFATISAKKPGVQVLLENNILHPFSMLGFSFYQDLQ